jgi:lactose/L-arabinose transport system permease protein
MALQAVSKSRARTPTRARPPIWREISKSRWAYAFISPFYILWLIFGLGPFLFSFYMILTRWDGLGPIEFIGLRNFEYIFTSAGGRVFWQSILNGVILFWMYVPLMTFLAIVLAVVLNSKRVRGFRFFRTVVFSPYVTSMIAAGFAFRLLLEQNGGLVNIILSMIGLPGLPWLESVWGARVSLCLLVIWGWLGYNMVLMLAGLQTIPQELTEAAQIDGASPVQAFFTITIPLLRPMILFSVILSIMGTFSLFNEVTALTTVPGGPLRANLTPIRHIYNVAFQDFQYGRASAMSYMYAVLILGISLLQIRYFGRER